MDQTRSQLDKKTEFRILHNIGIVIIFTIIIIVTIIRLYLTQHATQLLLQAIVISCRVYQSAQQEP